VASWNHSGTLVGAAIASLGFVADIPYGIATSVVQYPREIGSVRTKLNLFVTFNDFVATATTFTLYKNGIATALNEVVAATLVGLRPQVIFNVVYAMGDTFDLGVSNPGGVAEVGKSISFGTSVEFS